MRSPLYDFFVDRDSLNRTLPVAVASDKGISIRLFEDDGTADILVSKFRTRDSRRQVDAGVLRYADLVGHATLPLGDTG
jgi:hypothetical protein